MIDSFDNGLTNAIASPSKSPSNDLSITGLIAIPLRLSSRLTVNARTPESRNIGSRHKITVLPSRRFNLSQISPETATVSMSNLGSPSHTAVAELGNLLAIIPSRIMLCLPENLRTSRSSVILLK